MRMTISKTKTLGVAIILCVAVLMPQDVDASTLSCSQVDGMAIFGYKYGEWEFIGAIANEFDSDSIANEFGAGNEFSSDSIFNEFGSFGGEFSSYSAFNDFASKPPIIVNDGYKFVGYLTVNDFKTPNINTYEAIACARNSFRSFSNSDLEDTVFKSIPSGGGYSTGSSGYSQQDIEDLLKSFCPANSHTSATDSTICQCDAGYQPNATKDGCSLAPIKSNIQVCQDGFGVNVDWDGTKAANGDLNCNCKAGYIWNAGRSACILPPAIPTPPKISTPTASQTETKPVTYTSPAKKEFLIDDAKIKNYNVELLGETNTSATLRKCPSTNDCDALRYYVEGVRVKILGDYNNGEWYKIIVMDTKQEGWMHSSIVNKVALQEAKTQPDESKESDGKFYEKIPVSEKTQKDAPWYKKVFGFFSNLFK